MAGNARIFRYVPPASSLHIRSRRRREPRFPGRRAAGLLLTLAVLAAGLTLRACRKEEAPVQQPPETDPAAAPATPAAVAPRRLRYGFPTDQIRLLDTEDATVYMPTGSGRVVSALFGSTRTTQRGGRLAASFHEGIDIAPLRRDRQGRPLDDIRAVADGRVGYVNRVAGNSSYGIYVVLLHEDAVGTVYSLYAHLTSAAEGLREGDPVERGQVVGRMGNTSTLGIPMQRAHLHLEVGTMMNRRFDRWFRAKGLKPTSHGQFNGLNLRGLDPVELYRGRADDETFCFLDWFRSAEPAFSVVVSVRKPLDYFERHPALWTGGPRVQNGAIVLYAQEGGLVLRGRAATGEEQDRLGDASAAVLSVNEEALGRNGRRIVVREGGRWVMGAYGRQWIEKLTY